MERGRKGPRHNCVVPILKVVILTVISEKGGSIMENKWGTGGQKGDQIRIYLLFISSIGSRIRPMLPARPMLLNWTLLLFTVVMILTCEQAIQMYLLTVVLFGVCDLTIRVHSWDVLMKIKKILT